MIHCITFPPQHDNTLNDEEPRRPSYSSTYVDTLGRQLEQQQNNDKKFKGTLGGVPRAYPMLMSIMQNAINFQTLQAQKDTCNTALAEHGGRLLATMEQCPPTEIAVSKEGRITTLEASTSLDGAIDRSVPISGGTLSAHGRTDPKTGDRIHVSYRSDAKPYLRLDVFEKGWKLKESIGVDIPTPIFLHDSCITENYVVVMDLPLTLRTSRMLRDKFPVEYEPDHPARIGLVPRDGHGKSGEAKVIWFDCQPGVVLHLCNAWESKDGNTVVIQGLRSEPAANKCYLEQFVPSYYYEYSIDLTTGVVTEETLNPQEIVEFPMVNEKYHGQECSATYCLRTRSVGGPLHVYQLPRIGATFDSVIKLAAMDAKDHNKGDLIGKFQMPSDWYLVTEPTVVPKHGREGEYLLLIATHVPEGVSWDQVEKDDNNDAALVQSKVMIVDGDNLAAGPLYSATLPHRVPYGLHSGFLHWDHMK